MPPYRTIPSNEEPLIFREKVPNSPPRSLPYLALFDFKKA
ncbi:hypothetical protein O53_4224 [Microcystis aeruginosa TAIHU98]|uniref:Uncharacterized protein n=1 Tax=Microcystis aeruginosa TAIHU98 TaxID=1134457 RepID=L7E9N2_MICAE|nr:hypothetical protein O53_4224 [Microcystis aeruginosa TAIHU98]ODV39355.1 hypothetical protein BFG60_1117 [Microcystis aeruginosa NIES-98]